jgi:DNA-binding NarL/FixJ family response regulator
MVARIAVHDPLPAFCRGVVAILREAGFDAEAPRDLRAWVRDDEAKLLFFTILAPPDWLLLDELRQIDPAAVVVAMLTDMSVDNHVRALTAGAVAAVPRDASAVAFREVFEAIGSGRSLVPLAGLRALVQRSGTTDDDEPSHRERAWLRDLAGGMTVAELAAKSGYSERMMFRLLRQVYSRCGVRTKVEALLLARARGWL